MKTKTEILSDVIGVNEYELYTEDLLNYHVPLLHVLQSMDEYAELFKSKWIPVNERLPDERVPVLVIHIGNYPEGYDNKQVCYLINNNFNGENNDEEITWSNADTSFSYQEVTHWMPLP